MLPNQRRFPGERHLLTGLAVDALGSGMYVPFSLVFFRQVTGLPLPLIGLVLTVTGLAAMGTLPLVGTAVDRYGVRRVQLALYGVRAAGFAAYPFATSLPAFFAVALVTAVATRAFPAVQQARIGELVAGADLERLQALSRSLANAGLGAGSLLAALLVGYAGGTGCTAVAWLNAASFLIAGALASRVPAGADAGQRRTVQRAGYQAVLSDRPFLGLTVANFLIALGYGSLSVLLPVYATAVLHTPQSLTGIAFAVNTVLCAALGVPAGRLVRRFGSRNRAAATGAAIFAAGFLGQALLGVLAPGSPLLIAGMFGAVVVTTLGEIVHNPAAGALVSAAAPPALRGRYMAAYQLSWSLSAALAPSLLTGLMVLDGRLPWLVLAVGALLGAALLLRLERSFPVEAVRPAARRAAPLVTAA